MVSQIKIGEYLIRQLAKYGIKHVFGIPGDFILGFYDMLERCEHIRLITTCDEQGAGFAADAYARVSGLGAVCVTYRAGGTEGRQYNCAGLCGKISGHHHQRRTRG